MSFHFSSHSIVKLDNRHYEQETHCKPNGFWLSDETDSHTSWSTFVREELCYTSGRYIYVYSVQLHPEANLLVLDTMSKMYSFTKKYRQASEKGGYIDRLKIHWEHVSKKYQGILITPYHYQLRLNDDFLWYYPWDVASGCIWDTTAICSITPIQGG